MKIIQLLSLKRIYPHIIAATVFLVITYIFFYPMLEGKKLQQSDMQQWEGMSKEILDYKEKYDEEILWTGSMFSGMPAYQIHTYDNNPLRYVMKAIRLGMTNPARYLFLYFLGFYILLITLRVNPWLSITGAIAFGFSSYFIIILAVGHITKAHAIGYMPLVMAGVYLLYRRKYLTGAVVTALFLSLQIMSNHYQISYYLLILLIITAIAEFIHCYKNKELRHYFIATALLMAAGSVSVLANISKIYTTYEYSSETTRGKSELTFNEENKTTGLDKDYITGWSYGIQESLTLLIPNAKGGADAALSTSPKAMENVDRNYREIVGQFNHYWGNQPFTAGPVYVGAIVFFLFILSLFVLRGPLKWILVSATILSLMLAWGKNFMILTDLFVQYVPGYNKFRSVSMALVIAELTIPLLAFLGLHKILSDPALLRKNMKIFWISLGLSGGLVFILLAAPDLFLSFMKNNEAGIFANWSSSGATPEQIAALKSNLVSARIAVFRADATRSLLYILAGAATIYLFVIRKTNTTILFIVLFVLIIADLFTVNKRYLGEDQFVRKSKIEAGLTPAPVNRFIIEDEENHFRVLNLTVSTFNDATTSYFHKSIGGYHGAKLGRYQEVIEFLIQPEIEELRSGLSKTPMSSASMVFADLGMLNMLNTKYVIINPDSRPLLNPHRLGNAWLVDTVYFMEDANQEIQTLADIDPGKVALVDKRFRGQLENISYTTSPSDTIFLKEYHPERMKYEASAESARVAVFSEIYYPHGWHAYIDGEKEEHFRTDYLLRGLMIPQGVHEIEFRFEPGAYYLAQKVSYAVGYLIIILSLIILGLESYRQLKKKNKNN